MLARRFMLAAGLAVTGACPLAAQERWRPIFTDNGVVVSVDTTRLTAANHYGTPVLVAWMKWRYAKPQRGDSARTYVQEMERRQLTCKPLASFTDYDVKYDADGQSIYLADERVGYASTLQEPAPDTRGEAVVTALCRWFGYLIH